MMFREYLGIIPFPPLLIKLFLGAISLRCEPGKPSVSWKGEIFFLMGKVPVSPLKVKILEAIQGSAVPPVNLRWKLFFDKSFNSLTEKFFFSILIS
jgi:hypothetical protein